ncbi:MAG: hypothetical protein ACE5HS_13845 [bacterium]
MKKSTLFFVAALAIHFLIVNTLSAQVPQLINYQGILKDPTTGDAISGSKSMTFSIYSVPTGGTALWAETQTVVIDKGYFSTSLGSTNQIPYSVFSGGDRYLGVKVETDAEMTPRKRLLSVGYALKSHDADKVGGQDAAAFAPVVHNHDSHYYTKGELNTSDGDPPNTGSNRVSWNNLKDVPAGFADGADDVGAAGGVSQINVGTGMTVTNPTGPTTTLGLNMGHGNNINADMVDGKHASNFAASSHNHIGEVWNGSVNWNNGVFKVTNNKNGPSLWGLNTGGGNAVRGDGYGSSIGVYGEGDSGPGVVGRSASGDGVKGFGQDSGVYGEAAGSGGQGVFGKGIGANAEGVVGVGGSNGIGVNGMSTNQPGVLGTSSSNDGVRGVSTNFSGVRGNSTNGHGVEGQTNASSGSGVYGHSSNGHGVTGQSSSKNGVLGSTSASGTSGNGVKGTSSGNNSTGVLGEANNGSQAYGIWGKSTSGYAGYFSGNVYVSGTLSKAAGSFKIDHPLDPANKYLSHSFVESPDMMNIYNGNIALDAKGEAVVTMPEWFDVLNKDFRYQLTAIGAPGPNLYVAEEISGNRFRIAGGTPGMKVSWQVTGIRQDAFANAHRIPVEEDKPHLERGKYLNPKELGMPETMSIESVKEYNIGDKNRLK